MKTQYLNINHLREQLCRDLDHLWYRLRHASMPPDRELITTEMVTSLYCNAFNSNIQLEIDLADLTVRILKDDDRLVDYCNNHTTRAWVIDLATQVLCPATTQLTFPHNSNTITVEVQIEPPTN